MCASSREKKTALYTRAFFACCLNRENYFIPFEVEKRGEIVEGSVGVGGLWLSDD